MTVRELMDVAAAIDPVKKNFTWFDGLKSVRIFTTNVKGSRYTWQFLYYRGKLIAAACERGDQMQDVLYVIEGINATARKYIDRYIEQHCGGMEEKPIRLKLDSWTSKTEYHTYERYHYEVV